jgi:hypothetical protein
MLHKHEAGILLPMTVTEGLTVRVLPNEGHEYLMTTKEVASGYGVTEYNIRQHRLQHPDELKEGKHFITAVSITNGDLSLNRLGIPHNSTLWTKRGIVRLGFFIKSERAKLFRDWAEELIIRVDERRDLFGTPVPERALPRKRNHNRLTSERLIRLLQLTHRIDDAGLRNEIVGQLMGGH